MAAKKTEPKFSYRQFQGLGAQVGIQGLFEFVKRTLAVHKPFQRNSSAIRMNCPFHGDKTPSFDIDVNSGWASCFGCTYRTRYVLEFLVGALGWTYQEVLTGLQAHTSVPLLNDKQNAKLEELENYEIGELGVLDVCNRHLMDSYVAWTTQPPEGHKHYTREFIELTVPTLEWLVNVRHHDPAFFTQLPVGMLPPYHMLEEFMKNWLESFNTKRESRGLSLLHRDRLAAVLKGVEDRYSHLEGAWIGAAMYFCGRGMRQPGRTRLRRPHQDSKEILTLPGAEPDAEVGCFGLMRPNTVYRAQDAKDFMVIGVEGENDAWSLMESLLRAGRNNVMAISIGGHSTSLDLLHNAGLSRLYLVGDEPTFGKGHDFVYSRLQTASELEIMVFDKWPELRQNRNDVKDPDDAVHLLGFDWVEDQLVNRVKTAYLRSEQWASAQAHREYLSSEEGDSVRERTRIAAKYGKAVRNHVSQAEYVRQVSTLLDISPGPLRLEILRAVSTEADFLMRIEGQLLADFLPLYRTSLRGNPAIQVWHREQRRAFTLPMNDGESAAIQLSAVYGNMVDYFINTIGLPSYLGYDPNAPDDSVQQPYKRLHRDLYDYLKAALQRLYKGLPEMLECVTYGQGLQFLADPADILAPPGRERHVAYIINGTAVFKGTFVDKNVQWAELPGPTDGHYLFDVGSKKPTPPWTREIQGLSDLLDASSQDVKWAIDLVENWISTYWRFRHQAVSARYVTFLLFALAVSCAFPTQNMTQFTGETHSGKSSLLTLFSGIMNQALRLLENSRRVENFSMASIYQTFNGVRTAMIIDEFETGKAGSHTHKAQAVENVTQTFRNMINASGTNVGRFGKDGEVVNYNLQSNVVMVGINQAQTPEDANRRIEIVLLTVPDQRDPLEALQNEVSAEIRNRVRRTMTIGLLPYIAQLRDAYYRVEAELQRGTVVSNIPSRYLKNFYHVCAVMECFGYDWRTFVKAFCDAYREKITMLAAESSSQELYDRLFFSTTLMLPGGKGARTSLNEALATEELWPDINRSGCGFYFIPEARIGVAHWISLQTGLLSTWREYVEMYYRSLKDRLDRHPSALRTDDFRAPAIWSQIQRVIPGVKPQDVSVLDLRKFIEEVRDRGGYAPSASPAPAPAQPIPVLPVAACAPTSAQPALKEVTDADNNLP